MAGSGFIVKSEWKCLNVRLVDERFQVFNVFKVRKNVFICCCLLCK